MAGSFELYEDKAGKFRWRLKAGNHEVIAVGEAFETKAGAQKGIERVRAAAADEVVVDQTLRPRPLDSDGEVDVAAPDAEAVDQIDAL